MVDKLGKSQKAILRVLEKAIRDTCENCETEVESLRAFIADITMSLKVIGPMPRYHPTLVDMCYGEFFRQTYYLYCLSLVGFYRNAFDSLRYIFELMVQSFYIDSRHPKASLRTKIDILKEVEDKREYHAIRLIDELEIDHKDALRKVYKKLSRAIHPTHQSVVTVLDAVSKGESIVGTSNCEAINEIRESAKMLYDAIWFLYISHLPEKEPLRQKLMKDTALRKCVEAYDLPLLAGVLKTHRKRKPRRR
jgi:hypothetical protein